MQTASHASDHDHDARAEGQPSNVIRLSERRVRLHTSSASSEPLYEVTADVGEDGLVVREPGELPAGRFLWMDFELPDGEPVRALGEVIVRRDATSIALDIKFKHLFPDHKRRLLVALGQAGRG